MAVEAAQVDAYYEMRKAALRVLELRSQMTRKQQSMELQPHVYAAKLWLSNMTVLTENRRMF